MSANPATINRVPSSADKRRKSRALPSALNIALAFPALFLCLSVPSFAAGKQTETAAEAQPFLDNFDKLDRRRWYISDGWTNGSHQNCTWSKDEVKDEDGHVVLSFDKKTYKDRAYSCAEIQTKKRYFYGVYEARMKTDTGAGLNAAFFTFIGSGDKQPHDEIDFEVLTKNPGKVQVNAFASGKGGNEKLVDVAGGANAKFHDYAFVWEPNRIRWYVDGKLVNTITDPAKIPTHPQKIFFSLWGSDNMTGWMGKFSDPGRPVTLTVDRVAFTPLGQPCQFEGSLACNLH